MGAQRKLRILCTRELQKSIKESVHNVLKSQIKHCGLEHHYEVFNTEIKGKNGTEFIFSGIRHNPEEIKSMEGIDICWVEEASNVTDASWDILTPTIRKDGSEIWVSFNTRFKFDPCYQRFVVNTPPNTVVKKINYKNYADLLPQTLLDEAEHLKRTDYEKYLNVWEGEFKTLAEGAIYGDQIIRVKQEERICNIPIESALEVHTFWDLGKNDHTAIWFMQHVGMEYRFIDYYENRLKDLDHYARVIKGQCEDESETDNYRRRKYLYGTHYLPHDVDVQLLGMSRSRKHQLQDAGVSPIRVVPRIQHLNEGIEMTRKVFAQCWFDKKHCERGFEALSNYRYVLDEERDSYKAIPEHDWASDGADAFRQFAQGYHVKLANHPTVDAPLARSRRLKRKREAHDWVV